jgi:hypothetical protein
LWDRASQWFGIGKKCVGFLVALRLLCDHTDVLCALLLTKAMVDGDTVTHNMLILYCVEWALGALPF